MLHDPLTNLYGVQRLGQEMADFGQTFCSLPAMLGLSLQPLAGVELGHLFDHQLLDDRGPASDDEEEDAQQTSERQPAAQHCPRLQTLLGGQIRERRGEAQPPTATRELHSRLPVQPHRRFPVCRIVPWAQVLRLSYSAIIERAPVRRGHLVLNPQHDAFSLQALQRGLDHSAELEHAGDIPVQVLAVLLQRRVRQRRAIQRQEDQQPG